MTIEQLMVILKRWKLGEQVRIEDTKGDMWEFKATTLWRGEDDILLLKLTKLIGVEDVP